MLYDEYAEFGARCAFCEAPNPTKRCSKCKQLYCSQKCQHEHLSYHKAVCFKDQSDRFRAIIAQKTGVYVSISHSVGFCSAFVVGSIAGQGRCVICVGQANDNFFEYITDDVVGYYCAYCDNKGYRLCPNSLRPKHMCASVAARCVFMSLLRLHISIPPDIRKLLFQHLRQCCEEIKRIV